MLVKVKDHHDDIYYRAICECNDPRCDVEMTLSVDNWGYMTMEWGVETRAYPRGFRDGTRFQAFFGRIWWRIKTAIKILFTGRLEVYHDIMVSDPKQFQKEFNEGVAKIEEIRILREQAQLNKESQGIGTMF